MSWAGPACSARSLVAAGLAAREDLQGIHTHLGVVHLQKMAWAQCGKDRGKAQHSTAQQRAIAQQRAMVQHRGKAVT